MVGSRVVFRWGLMGLVIFAMLVGSLLVGGVQPQSGVQAATCWKAEITEQWTNTDLAGSVLRVSVEGKRGLLVVVRSRGSFTTSNLTGTKPEYGPYVAEFAPLSKGGYSIEPQGLGLVFGLWLDGKSYTRVDFYPTPCRPTPTASPLASTPPRLATATRQPATTPTPTPATSRPPQPATGWRGRVAQHLVGLEGRYFATIAVRAIGRPAGQRVEIASQGWSATCTTGTKPEHGPDACEFGALNAGTYRLTPTGLGTYLDVSVGLQDFVLVEFYYVGPPPRTRWVGSVVENTSSSEPTEHANSAIAVVVAGRPWHEVEIRAGGYSATCTTGYKPEYGPDACEFGGLRASTYTVTPKDLGTSVQVTVDGWGWAKVRFAEVPLPPPAPTATQAKPTATPTSGASAKATPRPSPTPAGTRWKGWVVSNTSGEREGTGVWSVVIARVINLNGVTVAITGGGGWHATCVTGTKPEYGSGACEFGGLWPGTYIVQPEGADVQLEVVMDGLGTAIVEFASP